MHVTKKTLGCVRMPESNKGGTVRSSRACALLGDEPEPMMRSGGGEDGRGGD